MKLFSWNVNGIRAAQKKGFLDWFSRVSPDVVCVQEIKALPEDLDPELRNPYNYHSFWHPAQKKGYSGVATFSKIEPLSVEYGLNIPEIDNEGRVLTLEYADFYLINSYFPNSRRDHSRLTQKLFFCDSIFKFLKKKAETKPILLCGDLNIAHREIDLKNPKTNQDNAGFLPEERSWIEKLLTSGFTDTFRHFNQEANHYTWWSYRPGVREKNIGWRLDYFITSTPFIDKIKTTRHHPSVLGSDHCPVEIQIIK